MLKRIARGLIDAYRARFDSIGYARSIGVRVGSGCRFLGIKRTTFGSEPYLIRIGDHVTITAGCTFVTHDGGVWVFRDQYPDIDVIAPIVIGNNVFIGVNSTLLAGVTIGDNVVIGAGSLVTRPIAPNQVVGGVPARPLRTLDEYWDSISRTAVHIRSLPYAEKRRILEAKFEDVLDTGGDRAGGRVS